ncbi:HNH endonuclease signature motif containing protein [Singulisphaera sp. GP187]|uniref:HNH endonuclease n=1 Tax=Singulisphaera sp. GP187 TaxID=1882752 RepID=UPI0020B14868|nr:HNH endonuclease signature motif containing protein [Singulisphaera sp. GP187]
MIVRDQALRHSHGTCESCGNSAPFTRPSGEPYLEVHHIDRLADGGPDRIDRVAAICPNCHARCYYNADSASFNNALRQNIQSKAQVG